MNTYEAARRTCPLRPEASGQQTQPQAALVDWTTRTEISGPIRILRLLQVMNAVGLRRAFIYRLLREGRFPKSVKLTGGRAVGWIEQEIQAWIRTRIRESDHAR